MKLVCVDGVSAVGKSTVLAEVRKQLGSVPHQHTTIFLTEHIVERIFEDDAFPADQIQEHLLMYLDLIDQMEAPLRTSKFADRMHRVDLWVIWERSWMTHVINQGHAKEEYTGLIDRLSELNAEQVILTIPEHEFEPRLVTTLDYRNDYWREYWNSLGATDTERIDYFRKWQQQILDLGTWSEQKVDTRVIEVPTGSYAQVAEQIVQLITE